LLFDQIKVIQQPFRSRRDAAILCSGGSDQIVSINQDNFVLCQTRQQTIFHWYRCQSMGTSDAAGVTFQLIDVQQFGPQRRFLNRHILMLRSARNLRPKQQAIQTVFELG
jgi:hypothetical protein